MARTLDEHLAPPQARCPRRVIHWLREQAIGAPALLALSWAFAILMANLLLWAGITHDFVRAVLLLLAAACAWGRRLASRLGAVTSMDGRDEPAPLGHAKRRGDIAQEALILLAAGFCALGSGFFVLGPAFGALAAVLLVGGAWIADHQAGVLLRPKPDPALAMAVVAVIAACEPAWHWRGECVVIGLFAVCAALVVWVVRQARLRA